LVLPEAEIFLSSLPLEILLEINDLIPRIVKNIFKIAISPIKKAIYS